MSPRSRSRSVEPTRGDRQRSATIDRTPPGYSISPARQEVPLSAAPVQGSEPLDYWNHNSVYHPMIVSTAEKLDGDVLNVGCGEGLLVERLAGVSRSVTGIDRDERALRQAAVRTAGLTNTTLLAADFMEFDVAPGSYDLITVVAVLHHLDLEWALRRSAEMLRPGGSAPGGRIVRQQVGR